MALPAGLPTTRDPRLLAKVRELLLVGSGMAADARLDSWVTLRQLQDAGLVTVSQRFLAGGTGAGQNPPPVLVPVAQGGGSSAPDLTPPPMPTGFSAIAGVTQIMFELDAAVYTQGHGPARTRIYAAPDATPAPTFADAVLYTDFFGNVGVAPFDPAKSLRLWATWVSVDGVESLPAGGTNGVAAATGLLEDQHIANMVVGKLLAGTLAVGQYMQSPDYVAGTSGWRLGSLVGGEAFFEMRGNAVFGGTIYAAAGTIGGSTIGSNYMRSTNYVLNTQGWNLQSDGTGQIGGLAIGTTYIQSTNFSAGVSGYRWNSDGSFQSKQFNISAAGAATFSGALSAASGTFAGSLSAATGTFAGSLSAASGTFTGSLSGASGTFSGSLTAQVVDTANIVGAAVTSVYPAYGGTSPGVSFNAQSGDRSLVVFVYTGTYTDSGTGAEVVAKVNLSVNGSVVAAFTGNGVHVIDSPSGSYSIWINYVSPSSSEGRVVVLHTKR